MDMNQNKAPAKLFFASDYMEGAHPLILQRLMETNLLHTVGYGTDEFSESARAKVRKACNAPDADVYFLVGGTQTNATVIGSILRPYQGVIAAETGHVSTHEAGAIEAGGHKVITLPHKNGKLDADTIERCIQGYWDDANHEHMVMPGDDANHEHMVMPGLVYISQPTEFGTLYSLEELTKISETCHKHDIPLYVDGARLAYGLACKQNDVTLTDLARLCDAFYIGGTKCGALFGEAVVLPRHDFVPHFFTLIKQNGALLAKGRIAGIQFETLFSEVPGSAASADSASENVPLLYEAIGQNAIDAADRIRAALIEKGYEISFECPTNQLFITVDDTQKERLEALLELSFWEKLPDGRTVLRICTSWATDSSDVDKLIEIL